MLAKNASPAILQDVKITQEFWSWSWQPYPHIFYAESRKEVEWQKLMNTLPSGYPIGDIALYTVYLLLII